MNERRAHLVFAPGLDPERWPLQTSPALTRQLAISFPASPATLVACAWTGRYPVGHGVLGAHDPLPRSPLDASDHITWETLDAVERAWRDQTDVEHAQTRVSEQVDARLARTEPGLLTMVCLGPARARATHQVEIELDPEWNVEEGLLRVPGQLSNDQRDGFLRTRGVERVLADDALRSWGLAPGETLVVAEPGWTFDASHSVLNAHRDAHALLLTVGAGREDWPDCVHDVRIAPTLAAFVGLQAEFDDRPLKL